MSRSLRPALQQETMRCCAVALVLLTLTACSGEDKAAEKERAWVEATRTFFSQPRTLDDLHGWLRSKNVYYTFDATDVKNGMWKVGVEQVYVDTLFCEAWNIYLTVQVAPSGAIKDHAVTKAGRCL